MTTPAGYRLQPVAEFDAYREVLAKMDALERRCAALQREAARWRWARARLDAETVRELAFDYPNINSLCLTNEREAQKIDRLVDRQLHAKNPSRSNEESTG